MGKLPLLATEDCTASLQFVASANEISVAAATDALLFFFYVRNNGTGTLYFRGKRLLFYVVIDKVLIKKGYVSLLVRNVSLCKVGNLLDIAFLFCFLPYGLYGHV